MIIELVFLLKLILAHLVTDFILQPTSWIEERYRLHFASPRLYLHALITAVFAWIIIGWQYWWVAIIILVTHMLIDAWKSYRKENLTYFLWDQGLHILVLTGCWYFSFIHWTDIQQTWQRFSSQPESWKNLTGLVFLTMPASILVEQFTKQWRDKIKDGNDQVSGNESLANAGKWIGIIERIIIFFLVLHDKYEAIGLLVAAKSIIRFNEKDRPEIKTEYLVVGTLVSIGLAMLTGWLIKI